MAPDKTSAQAGSAVAVAGAAAAAVAAAVESITVSVVYCAAPAQVDEVQLRLPAGATLSQALHASGVLQRNGLSVQSLDRPDALQVGIWGRIQSLDTVLRERDRVELYRPLLVDPKEARRLRYGRHKAAVQARKDRLAAAAAAASG
jgi:uncharacterized protein